VAPENQSLELLVESLSKSKLHTIINETLKRRLHASQFYLEVTTDADPARINELVAAWGFDNVSLLRQELRGNDYFEMRTLLSSASVIVRYSDRIAAVEWEIVEGELNSILSKGEGEVFEQIDATSNRLTPDLSENLMLLRAKQEREQLEQEYKLQTDLEEKRSQLREKETQKKYDLKKQLSETEKSALENELQSERQKRFEMADVMSKDLNVREYIVRNFPLLTRFAAVGSGLGAFIVIALIALGVFLIIASSSLGRHLKSGVHEVAIALKGKNENESERAQALKADKESGRSDEELESDNGVAFDHKPQLKEAADKLRAQVERDFQTTAVVLSKVVEEEKYGEVIAIFDILGPDLARSVFRNMTSTARKRLQRAFYTGQIKRPTPAALFNRINELRAMLASTDVMMSEVQDKEFAQIVLAYPDEEIATALLEVPVDDSVSLLSRLPPERMLSIIRSLPQVRAEEARSRLGKIVHRGVDASLESIRCFTGSIMNEGRLRFEESKKFLQGVIEVASDTEAENIISGLRFDPKLLMEVIGIRASIDDLWAQSIETIEELFSGLELDPVITILQSAPPEKRSEITATFPPRKQALARDIIENIASNPRYGAELEAKFAGERKNLLGQLSEMAKAGSVLLPSYERLKAEVATQQELEKEGVSYEDYIRESEQVLVQGDLQVQPQATA
jgi:hypothetical protein